MQVTLSEVRAPQLGQKREDSRAILGLSLTQESKILKCTEAIASLVPCNFEKSVDDIIVDCSCLI